MDNPQRRAQVAKLLQLPAEGLAEQLQGGAMPLQHCPSLEAAEQLQQRLRQLGLECELADAAEDEAELEVLQPPRSWPQLAGLWLTTSTGLLLALLLALIPLLILGTSLWLLGSDWLDQQLPLPLVPGLIRTLVLLFNLAMILILLRPWIPRPPQAGTKVPLAQAQEPQLRQWIETLCLRIGVASPQLLQLTVGGGLEFNARWPWQGLRGIYRLRMGLALLKGLDQRQLGALLAQQAAIYAQGPGRGARILLWHLLQHLQQAAQGEDALERFLALRQRAARPLPATLERRLRQAAQLSRAPWRWLLRLFWALAGSRYQRLIYQADHLGGLVGGSEALQSALKRQRLLRHASVQMDQVCREHWQSQGFLPINLPHQINSLAQQLATRAQTQLEPREQRARTELRDLRPALAERAQRLQALALVPALSLPERPALSLLQHPEQWSRRCCFLYYHNHLELRITTDQLRLPPTPDAKQKLLERYTLGLDEPLAPYQFPPPPAPEGRSPASLLQLCQHELRSLKQVLEAARKAQSHFHRINQEIVHLQQADYVHIARLPLAPDPMLGGLQDHETIRQRLREQEFKQGQALKVIASAKQHIARRLQWVTQLAQHPQTQARLANGAKAAAMLNNAVQLLARTDALLEPLRQLREHSIALESLLACDIPEHPQAKLTALIGEKSDDIRQILVSLQIHMQNIEWRTPKGPRKLSQQLPVPQLKPDSAPYPTLEAGQQLLDGLLDFRLDLLRHAALYALHVERAWAKG